MSEIDPTTEAPAGRRFRADLRVPPTEAPTDSEPLEDRRRNRSWMQFPRAAVVLYTLAFIAAEAVGAYVGVAWQIALTAVLLLVAVNHALFGYRNVRTAAVVMTALFASRLVTLTLPVAPELAATRTAIIAVVAILISRLAIWVMAHDVTQTRDAEGFPLRKPIITRSFTTVFVALSGIPIGLLTAHVVNFSGFDPSPLFDSLAAAWVLISVFLALGALGEEVLYRQLVAAMVQHTGASQTPIFSGLLYGSIFLGTGNLQLVGLAALTGMWFAWSCERTGSLRGPIFAHIIISLIVFVISPNL